MSDGRLLILLVLTSPIWIVAVLVTLVWYGLWAILSFLPLPTIISGPLAILMLALLVPFGSVAMAAQHTIGVLLRERNR